LLLTVLVPGLIGLFVKPKRPNDRINIRRRGKGEEEEEMRQVKRFKAP